MRFGERVRVLRSERGISQQKLAERLSVSLSYVSKVESERLNTGNYPSESFIRRLAQVLETDEDELMVLSHRVPVAIRRRVCERPDVFRELAELSDSELDELMKFRSKPR